MSHIESYYERRMRSFVLFIYECNFQDPVHTEAVS